MSDALDWTPQQALQKAIDIFDGKSDENKSMPDGVLILFFHEDGPVGDEKPKRSYLNSGLSNTQIMALCNYVNLLVFHDIEFKNLPPDLEQ